MNSIDRALLDERIDKGIALLDERIPNWRDRISLIDLDLGSPYRCVLGQVFDPKAEHPTFNDGFGIGVQELDIDASVYGFDLPQDFDANFTDMQEVWLVKLEGHVDYPHHPGFLHDCPGCESRCHCEEDSATCVWEPETNDHGGFVGVDRFGRHAAELRDN